MKVEFRGPLFTGQPNHTVSCRWLDPLRGHLGRGQCGKKGQNDYKDFHEYFAENTRADSDPIGISVMSFVPWGKDPARCTTVLQWPLATDDADESAKVIREKMGRNGLHE